jgi:hypothetical protein
LSVIVVVGGGTVVATATTIVEVVQNLIHPVGFVVARIRLFIAAYVAKLLRFLAIVMSERIWIPPFVATRNARPNTSFFRRDTPA